MFTGRYAISAVFAGLRASWNINKRRAGWVGLLVAIIMLDLGCGDRVESSDVSMCVCVCPGGVGWCGGVFFVIYLRDGDKSVCEFQVL